MKVVQSQVYLLYGNKQTYFYIMALQAFAQISAHPQTRVFSSDILHYPQVHQRLPAKRLQPYQKLQLKQGMNEKYLYFNDFSNSPIKNRLDDPSSRGGGTTKNSTTAVDHVAKSPFRENLIQRYKKIKDEQSRVAQEGGFKLRTPKAPFFDLQNFNYLTPDIVEPARRTVTERQRSDLAKKRRNNGQNRTENINSAIEMADTFGEQELIMPPQEARPRLPTTNIFLKSYTNFQNFYTNNLNFLKTPIYNL